MLVAQKVGKGVADEVHDEGVPAAGVVTKGDVSATHDEVPTVNEEPSIPSPTPLTPPPQPSQDIPSTSQNARIPINLLQEVIDTFTALTRRVKHLELDKIAQDLEITKLKRRVNKLERRNKVKGRMIADMDVDADVVLEETKEKIKEQIEEDERRALKRINKTPTEKAAKRQKLDEDVEELKRHLQIVPNKDDNVYTEATPLAHKVPVVGYEIINQNNKPYYKIIRADAQEVGKGVDDEVHDEGVPTAGVVTKGDVSAAHDEVPTVDEESSIPSPTPPTPPPQPSQDIPSTS
nr:hypothetical protein [Tanacetum cinerariifolium]